ncbi:uncharacterized protein LOC116238107 [Phasianus colchicus]|uniref:uncharacterized protein LOC116238107 n=1 Tax=Phasianus colchicus TaxID=9054 RepID=UPI00129D4051|nr:uncharacterized protein LOC116238107 [Phasianus colchicus]
MAATEEWMCPICREVRQDIATTTPCNHLFCLGCIQRWARLRASCPLCRIAMKTIKVSVWGDKQYIECVVSPPAVPVPASFHDSTSTVPAGTVAPSSLLLPPEQRGTGPELRERVGGLLPQEWAALFREQHSILNPVLPSLHQKLSSIPGINWWQVRSAESLFLCCLCQLGPDRDAMLQCIEPSMGSIALPLIVWLIDTIISRCSQEARRLRGLEDDGTAQELEDSPIAASSQTTLTPSSSPASTSADPDVQELPGTLSGVPHGDDHKLPSVPSSGEQEQPFVPGQEAAGPSAQGYSRRRSTPSWGRKRSSRSTQRPKKRRANNTQDAPQPRKRLPPPLRKQSLRSFIKQK